jgi:transposase
MAKTVRARYTLEFKREAVRLVEGGQSLAAAARTLGVLDQTLFNWVKAMLNKYPKFACGPRKLLI